MVATPAVARCRLRHPSRLPTVVGYVPFAFADGDRTLDLGICRDPAGDGSDWLVIDPRTGGCLAVIGDRTRLVTLATAFADALMHSRQQRHGVGFLAAQVDLGRRATQATQATQATLAATDSLSD